MTATLAEGQQWLEERMYTEDVDCPCCEQRVKVYRRKINSAQAASLAKAYVLLYNGRVLGFEGEQVTYSDAATTPFHLGVLMAGQ